MIGSGSFPAEDGILSRLDFPLYLIDPRSRVILWCNEAAVDAGLVAGSRFECGLRNHETGLSRCCTGPMHDDCPIGTVLRSGTVLRREAWFPGPDGEFHPFEVVTLPAGADGPDADMLIEYRLDAERRYRAEERLADERVRRDRAVAAKDEFLANISHEIRTPLNAILGFAQQLLPLTGDKRGREYLDHILHSGKGLLSLINDLIDLSRLEAGMLRLSYSAVSLPDLFDELESLYRPQAAGKGIELIFEPGGAELAALEIDELRIRQILGNLIGNAIKFTPSGGMVRVLAQTSGESTLSALEESVRLCLTVQDTGIGIPEEFHDDIFNPFLQHDGKVDRVYEGTGMGLAISRRLVTIMGGTIEVESRPGEGALFTVTIPRVRKADRHVQEGPAEPRRRKLVLVVDDYPSNRSILAEYLKRFSFDILEAENGKEALELVRRTPPDLVFMDISMPVMDGFQALSEIRREPYGATIPVVAVTSSLRDSQMETLKESGFQEALTKPVSVDTLVTVVERLLFGQAAGSRENDFFGAANAVPREEFRSLFLEEYGEVLKRNRLDETRAFAEKLLAFAASYGFRNVTAYGEELLGSVDAFDIERMVSLLEQFPALAGGAEDTADEK